MSKCEKCYHNKVCINGANYKNVETCKHFKDKDLIAELPCKVGGYVFEISGDEIYRWRIKNIILNYYGAEFECIGTELEEFKNDLENSELENYEDEIIFYEREFGKIVFRTREEAKAVLEERENNDT